MRRTALLAALALVLGLAGARPARADRVYIDVTGATFRPYPLAIPRVLSQGDAAGKVAAAFRGRSARKIYWALVVGVPKPQQGRVSTYLVKQEVEEDSYMRIAKHGDKDAMHAVTYYAVVETAAQKLAWISLKPVTGRTHQLRAHAQAIGHPIIGDPKYHGDVHDPRRRDPARAIPEGVERKLHLLARRIVLPHPRGGMLDVTAPLPEHMRKSFDMFGFDVKRYDPIENAPE